MTIKLFCDIIMVYINIIMTLARVLLLPLTFYCLATPSVTLVPSTVATLQLPLSLAIF